MVPEQTPSLLQEMKKGSMSKWMRIICIAYRPSPRGPIGFACEITYITSQ